MPTPPTRINIQPVFLRLEGSALNRDRVGLCFVQRTHFDSAEDHGLGRPTEPEILLFENFGFNRVRRLFIGHSKISVTTYDEHHVQLAFVIF